MQACSVQSVQCLKFLNSRVRGRGVWGCLRCGDTDRGLLFGAEASVRRKSGQVFRWHGAGDDRDMTPTFSAHETEGEFSFMTFSSLVNA